jgi:hypothetical protein
MIKIRYIIAIPLISLLIPSVVSQAQLETPIKPTENFTGNLTGKSDRPFVPQDIIRSEGLRYRSLLVSLPQNDGKFLQFPVQMLQVNLKQAGLQMRPILANPAAMFGTIPLAQMAKNAGAIAAINGGFFNINRKLPVGAIKQNQQWLAGAALYRGAIAWNQQGEILIDRLSYREEIRLPNQNKVELTNLNSGYVQKGIARYISTWGSEYTTLSDGEIIMNVQKTSLGDRLLSQFQASEAGKNSFSIPQDGYLLVVRQVPELANQLPASSMFTLKTEILPSAFANYPHLLGAGPLLLKDGIFVLDAKVESFKSPFDKQGAYRSAIATTSKPGEVLLVTIPATSAGDLASLAQASEILRKLGAVNALNLDGGGSTGIYLDGLGINQNLQPNLRPIHNAIGIFIN